MSLPRFSVRQVVLVNLFFAIVMVGGLLMIRRIPVDVFPDISFNSAVIFTVWTGASADEVERLVTTKLEEEIQEVDGIKEMVSFSSPGLSDIQIEWDETLSEIEYEAAVNELRAAIDRVNDLPEEAEEPVVRELSFAEVYNVCMIAITDVGGVGEGTLREVARDWKARIDRLPGVRKVRYRGMRDRELRVLVDRQRALQYGLTLPEISGIIAANNQNVPAGSFTDASASEITVRGLGNFVSREGLAGTVVKKSPDGRHVLLADVAEVEESFETRRLYGRYNGNDTILLGIAKQPDADVVDLVTRVRAFVDEQGARLPPGVLGSVTWDTSEYVTARMSTLYSNLALGVLAVVAVLWLTVGFRNSLLVIVGIPFSFLTAFLLFPVFDITINAMSLVGFLMVSGMLVDHAIIIVENVYRHIESGVGLERAVIEGTEEVIWPVIATVATTVAAFLPMLLVSSTSGEFMSILPKTVIVTLIGSLIEALVVLPAHYLDWGSRLAEGRRDTPPGSGLLRRLVAWSHGQRARVDDWLARARNGYLSAQVGLLEHRYAFLAVCLAALYLSCGVARHVPIDLFPDEYSQLFVTIQAPTDYGIDQTNQVVAGVEEVIRGLGDELNDFSTYVGMGMTADMWPINGTNYGVLYLSFPDTPENVARPERVLEIVRTALEQHRAEHPERFEALTVIPPRNGPPIGKPVAIRIQADDYGLAKRIAGEMKRELSGMVGVFNIEDNLPVGPRELRVALDEHRASLHGLTFAEVGLALRAANDGIVPSTFKDPASDEDVDIRVMLREEQRRSIRDLLEVEIRTPAGYLVQLGDVATIDIGRAYRQLYHYDAERAVVVYADVDTDVTSSSRVNAEMQRRFADTALRYPGVKLIFGGEFEATNRAVQDMQSALLVAILAIYAILAAQFRSYAQPLVVMSVVAFAFIGVILGLWAVGAPLSMYVMYAVIGLAGVVVNDSLVLMDFVNQERMRGTPVREALRLASSRRFRPILLTTVTTVAGLLPMAIGIGGSSRSFGPFATAFVSGLAVASLLTLFVVPALYLILEDARTRLRRRSDPAATPEAAAAAGR